MKNEGLVNRLLITQSPLCEAKEILKTPDFPVGHKFLRLLDICVTQNDEVVVEKVVAATILAYPDDAGDWINRLPGAGPLCRNNPRTRFISTTLGVLSALQIAGVMPRDAEISVGKFLGRIICNEGSGSEIYHPARLSDLISWYVKGSEGSKDRRKGMSCAFGALAVYIIEGKRIEVERNLKTLTALGQEICGGLFHKGFHMMDIGDLASVFSNHFESQS